MKKSALAILLMSFSFFSFSQNYVPNKKITLNDEFKLDWGNSFKDKNKSTAVQFIASIGDYSYVEKASKKGKFIDKVDSDMNLVATAELNMEYKGNELDFHSIVYFGNEVHVLSTYKNKKKEINYLFGQRFDPKSMKLTGDLVILKEMSYRNGSKRRAGYFATRVSQDSSLFMVYNDVPGKKDDREHFGISVFSAGLETVWATEKVFPYEDGLFQIESFKLDNKGEVFVLGKLYSEKLKSSRKGKTNYEMRLLGFSENAEEPEIYEIALNDIHITDMEVFFKEDQIICFGFYSKGYGTSADGCFTLSIDKKTKDILKSNKEEFSLDFITMNMSAKQKKKTKKKESKGKDAEIGGLEIRNVVVKENGELIVIAEQYFYYVTTTTTTNANGGTTTTTTHHYVYDDILLIGITNDLRISWYDKIPKSQHTTNDGGFYSGFYFVPTKDRMYFVYNDNIKNSKMLEGAKEYNFSGRIKTSVAVCVSVDYDGNKGKERLFNVKEESILIRPKTCGRTSKGEILVFGQLKKIQRYGIVERAN